MAGCGRRPLCSGRPTRRPSPAAVSGHRSVSLSDVMRFVAPLLTVLVTLLAVLPSGTAISCYQCSDALLDIDTDGDGMSAGVNDGLKKSLGDLGGAIGGMLDSVGKQLTQSPCTEFQPNEARFRNENCLLGNGCMKTVINDKTTRTCAPVSQDTCKENDGTVACVCSTDYCNAAGRGASVPPLLLLLPVAVLALLNSRL